MHFLAAAAVSFSQIIALRDMLGRALGCLFATMTADVWQVPALGPPKRP